MKRLVSVFFSYTYPWGRNLPVVSVTRNTRRPEVRRICKEREPEEPNTLGTY